MMFVDEQVNMELIVRDLASADCCVCWVGDIICSLTKLKCSSVLL